MKLNNEIMVNATKKHILEMLDLSTAEYLSKDITIKNKTLKKDHNKKLIKLIYNSKEEKIIDILDKSIRELLKIFCSNNSEYTNIKINRLKDEINKLKKKYKDKKYISNLEYEAKNYEDIYKAVKGRRRKK